MKVLAYKPFLLALLVIFTLQSCKKDEGPGGTSTIKGRIIVHDFDGAYLSPAPKKIYSAIDQKVYIIYGSDGTTYNDDFSTSYDGTYEFKYLQKGTYKLFTYSEDSTGASINFPSLADTTVFQTVEITSNGTTVTVPDLIILDNKQP